MAPTAHTQHSHPTLTNIFQAGISLIPMLVATLLPYSVSAAPLKDATALPDLSSFSLSVQNGDADLLRGVYVNGLFALPVAQQPSSNAAYVSTLDNTITQFSLASQFGSVGLLAHNNLSGQYFFQLMSGMVIVLIYGDGRIEYYQVSHVYRYQATAPQSVYSDFIDLDTQEYLSGSALFKKVYMGPKHITFQTCISQNGNSSWGRFFVLAEPFQYSSSLAGAHRSIQPGVFRYLNNRR